MTTIVEFIEKALPDTFGPDWDLYQRSIDFVECMVGFHDLTRYEFEQIFCNMHVVGGTVYRFLGNHAQAPKDLDLVWYLGHRKVYEEYLARHIEILANEINSHTVHSATTHRTANAYNMLLRRPRSFDVTVVQFLKKFDGPHVAVAEHDFLHTTGYYDRHQMKLQITPQALHCIEEKYLVPLKPFKKIPLLRVTKFLNEGYSWHPALNLPNDFVNNPDNFDISGLANS